MQSIADIKLLNEKNPDIAKCHGPTSLTTIGECNASRGIMLANNLRQTVVIRNPEPARVLSGAENTFGKLSHGYKKVSGDWEVLEKFKKYNDGDIYCIVLYNKETDTIDCFENPYAEDGPERFGFVYNSDNMDSKNVGDTVKDGEVLYKSTSYDENMNYCMGINARMAFLTGVSTLEDGIVIRSDFAKRVLTDEVTSFNVSINHNDVPLLIHEYDGARHSIPKIGQDIGSGNMVIATRKINKRKLAFDFSNDAVTKVRPTDTYYKAGTNSIVYDMDIYYNSKTEFPNNSFYKEIHDYYVEQCAYYEKIYQLCEKYKAEGRKFTNSSQMLHKRAKDFVEVDTGEFKWKDRERAFSNMVIKFKCIRTTSLHEGFKLVGRYGDKGVISEIRDVDRPVDAYEPEDAFDKVIAKMLGIEYSPKLKISVVDDAHMPVDEYGRYIDIYQNASGAYRRENTGQLSEVDLNFIAESIQDRVRWIALGGYDDRKLDIDPHVMTSLKPSDFPTPMSASEIISKATPEAIDDAFVLIMDFMSELTKYQLDTFMSAYKIKLDDSMNFIASKTVKKKVVEMIIADGFYIHKTPNNDLRFDKICHLYDKYPFIKRRTMYIEKFGILHKVVTPMVVGWKYMLVLKQTSNKNFSARNIGKVNKIGCPTKSADKKENRTNISDTPINRGETYNLFASLDATTLMTSDIFTKNSPIARRDLKDILIAPNDPYKVRKWKVKETYQNVNVLNFKARLKTLGITYDFVTNKTLRAASLLDYKTIIDVYEYSFIDYARNEMFYKFLVDAYNKAKRAEDNDEDQSVSIWQKVVDSEEYKYVNPPKEVFRTVMRVINACEERKAQELAAPTETEETTESEETKNEQT